jgi:inorganic pyrophosphatase
LEDLPKEDHSEIERFFEVYKRLERHAEAQIRGWLGLDDTHELTRRCTQVHARA